MADALQRRSRAPDKPGHPDWSRLLIDAVTQPGVISSAYHAFWNYSFRNQLLAHLECLVRGIEPGPIHTFNGWIKLGRHVRKGEKAITLCMPVSCKKKDEPPIEAESEDHAIGDAFVPIYRRFIYRARWFVLSQTDGDPYVSLAIPTWDEQQACRTLTIEREPFRHTDGNAQGYACGNRFAVSPIAYLPHRTMLHEMAHIVLGHTRELGGVTDGNDMTPRDVREVEAEAVSFICCQSIGLPGELESRGYLQHWLGTKSIDDRSAQRIFHAADTILKAGRPPATPSDS